MTLSTEHIAAVAKAAQELPMAWLAQADFPYPQPTPKQRILAFLKDLRDGNAKTTMQVMEEDYRRSLDESSEAERHAA